MSGTPTRTDSDHRSRLRGWYAYQCIGAILVLVIVHQSLTPSAVQAPWTGFDKVGHLLAYATLMAWYAQLSERSSMRALMALACVALGVTMEYAQTAVATRYFEWADMLANTLGVVAAWWLFRGRRGRLLHELERRLAGRR